MTQSQLDMFISALIDLAHHHDAGVRKLGKQLAYALDMQDMVTAEETMASLDQMRAVA